MRALVDDAEGTTRDPIDELVEVDGKTWRLIDTAGIRRRAHQAAVLITTHPFELSEQSRTLKLSSLFLMPRFQ